MQLEHGHDEPVPTALELVRPPAQEVRVTSADGTGLHVEISGAEDAPTIVLAHGIACSIKAWHYQIKALARSYRVVAFDQRGHGRSDRPGGDAYQVRHLADDLQAVLEECVPARRKAVLAGHSMGGMSILAWATHYSDQVTRRAAAAALVCTAARDVLHHTGGDHVPALATLVARRVSFAPVRTPILPGMRPGLRWLVFGAGSQSRDVALTAGMINACPGRTRAQFARSLSAMDLLEQVPLLDIPTVVVGGQQDRLLPVNHSRDIADQLPQLVEFQPLPRVGHMAPLEAPMYLAWRLSDLADRFATAPATRSRPRRSAG